MATSKLNLLDQDKTNINAPKAVKNKIIMKKVSAVPNNSAELTPKKTQYLTVRRLSDDEISEADSMARYLYLYEYKMRLLS